MDVKDTPVAGVEHTNTSAPVPSVDSAPADTEPYGTATSDTIGNTSHGSPNQPAPLRSGTLTTQNQLPWRYQNFGLLADKSTWHLGCMSWSVHLTSFHIPSVHCFCGKYGVNTSYLLHPMSAKHHLFHQWGEFHQCSLYGGFLDGGSGPKIIWSECNCPTRKKSKRVSPIETLGVCSSPTQKKVTGIAKSDNISPGAQCKVELIPQQFVLLKDNNWLSNKWLSLEQV